MEANDCMPNRTNLLAAVSTITSIMKAGVLVKDMRARGFSIDGCLYQIHVAPLALRKKFLSLFLVTWN